MIKEAFEFLASIQTPQRPLTVDLNGQTCRVAPDGTVGLPAGLADLRPPRPTMFCGTLSGIVAAYAAGVGKLGSRVGFQVVNYLEVELKDLDDDEFGKRHVYVKASHAPDTAFPFDKFLEPEDFLIKFRASFYFNAEAVKVQKLCSTVGAASGVAVADDGISQEVTTTSGTLTKANVTLPAHGIPLIPWRTFRDAAPVESKFLLRMRAVKDGLPQIALFEIDATWKLDTVNSIRSYLLGAAPSAVVIA